MIGIYIDVHIYTYAYICIYTLSFLALQNSACLTLWLSEAVHMKWDVSQIFLVYEVASTSTEEKGKVFLVKFLKLIYKAS